MSEDTKDRAGSGRVSAEADPLRLVAEALTNLRFGGIQLTVHEGKMVQMEVTEKRRFI